MAMAERLGLPLTVYLDILWEEGSARPNLAKKLEKRILRRADSRFAITEFAVEHLQKKHGLKFDLIPHVIDTTDLPSGLAPLSDDAQPVVHYSGTIYQAMNMDAVVRLAIAVGIAKARPTLDICTWDLPQELQDRGCRSRCLSREQVAAAQSSSTILFLPLAFDSPYPTMIRNNCAIKLLEYLRSGRPILVHAPAECYITYLARREGFALVVDRPDVRELAEAIDLLARDRSLQEQLVIRALTFVRTRDSRVWSQRLWRALCNN